MENHEHQTYDHEVQVSLELRDKLWAHLPYQAKYARQMVTATYFPDNINPVKLEISYEPHDQKLEIDIEETIIPTKATILPTDESENKFRFMIYKNAVLDGESGDISHYAERSAVLDEHGKQVYPDEQILNSGADLSVTDEEVIAMEQELNELENDLYFTMNKDKLNFILALFDNICT